MGLGLAGMAWDLAVLGLANWAMARRLLRYPGEAAHRPVLIGFAVVMAFRLPSLAAVIAHGGFAELQALWRVPFDGVMSGLSKGMGAPETAFLKNLTETWFWTPLPAWIVVFTLLLLVFDVAVLRLLLRSLRKISVPSPALMWALPHEAIWLLLLPGFAELAMVRFGNLPWVHLVSMNLLVLALPFYLVQGCLVAHWNMVNRGVPVQVAWVAWALLVFFAGPLFPAAASFLLLLGILDTWFDLRRLPPPPTSEARDEK
jgi:hypothetical protein